MKNLTWQNPEQLFVAQELINKVKSKCCGIKDKYICTNFFKTLLFFGRGTMQVSQDVFRFVPLQDFTSLSDIDWNKSILEIDNQFSAKYHLTNEEIAFVESMIKPM